MSYLGIMSRGYICPAVAELVVDVDPPTIISEAELVPMIEKSTIEVEIPPPIIKSAKEE